MLSSKWGTVGGGHDVAEDKFTAVAASSPCDKGCRIESKRGGDECVTVWRRSCLTAGSADVSNVSGEGPLRVERSAIDRWWQGYKRWRLLDRNARMLCERFCDVLEVWRARDCLTI